MAEVKWIKILTTMFDDEKIKLIESMPDCDTILVIWIKLLAQAGKCNASGHLILSQNIPYTDEMLATIFNRPLNTVRMALDTFKNFGMIEYEETIIHITNWEKHQNVEGMELIREQTKQRVKRHREKLKQLKECNVTCNVTETHSNAIDKDIDIDKEKELKDNTLSTKKIVDRVPHQKIMELFHSICISLPRIKEMTKTRQETIRVWFKSNPNIEYFEDYFKKVQASDFLTGRDDKWKKCCFDWIIKPANRQKVIEGNYDNKKFQQNRYREED